MKKILNIKFFQECFAVFGVLTFILGALVATLATFNFIKKIAKNTSADPLADGFMAIMMLIAIFIAVKFTIVMASKVPFLKLNKKSLH